MLIASCQPTGPGRRVTSVLCWSNRGEAACGISYSPNQQVPPEKWTLEAGRHLREGKTPTRWSSGRASAIKCFSFPVEKGWSLPSPLLFLQRQNSTEERLTKPPRFTLWLRASFLNWIKSLNTWLWSQAKQREYLCLRQPSVVRMNKEQSSLCLHASNGAKYVPTHVTRAGPGANGRDFYFRLLWSLEKLVPLRTLNLMLKVCRDCT